MYNSKNRVCISIGFCIGFMLCVVALVGCKDTEKQQAMARADAAEAELREAKTQLKVTQSERDELKTTVGDLSKSLQDFKSQLNTVTQLKDQVSAIITERDAAISKLKDQVSTIITERDGAIAKVAEAQTTIEKMTSQLQEQVQKVLALEELNKKLQAMIDELKKKLGDEIKLPQIPGM